MLCLVLSASGQHFNGRIIDEAGNPIAEASVILLDTHRKTVNFARSTSNGTFTLTGKTGRDAGYLVFSCVGFERDTIGTHTFVNGQDVTMHSKAIEIREVTVRADRVSVHGDTLNYNVAAFKQKQDRSIADVIKKMPGLDVKADGTIEFEGKAINKFYVEGMDLMGSKYAQASENLNAGKVKTVQVLQNHQPIKALKDVSFNEQAALNIVLQDDAKNAWQWLIDLGAGHTLQDRNEMLGDNRMMAMLFARRMQSVTMLKQNNTGKDIAREVGDIGALLDYAPVESTVLSNISLPAPGLKPTRSRFNQSFIAATNWLFKTRNDHDLRLQFNAQADVSHEQQYSETQYTDVASRLTVVEQNDARSHNNQVDGEIQYKANTPSLYLTNTLKGRLNFDYSHGMAWLNGNETRQNVKPRHRHITDRLQFIKNLTHGRTLQAQAYVSGNYLPGRLLLTDASMQQLDLTSFMGGLSTAWGHTLGKCHLTYSLAYEGKWTKYALDNHLLIARDSYSQHRTQAQAAWAYQNALWRLNATLPLSLLARKFNDNSSTSLIVEPQLFAIYEPSPRWQLMMLYHYAHNTANVPQLSAMPVYTDYITLRRGNGRFDDSRAHIATAHLQFKNTAKGFFARVGGTHSNLRHLPLYRSTLVDGIYCREITSLHSNSSNYSIDARVSESFAATTLSVSLSGSYNWSNHYLLQANELIPMQMQTANAAVRLAAQPLKWLSVEATSNWSRSAQRRRHSTIDGQALQSFDHTVRLFVMPGQWQVEWSTDVCHSNDRSVSTNTFSDLSISYRTKRYEIGLALNNLMGNSQYERRLIATTQATYTINRLRPREFLARVLFNL